MGQVQRTRRGSWVYVPDPVTSEGTHSPASPASHSTVQGPEIGGLPVTPKRKIDNVGRRPGHYVSVPPRVTSLTPAAYWIPSSVRNVQGMDILVDRCNKTELLGLWWPGTAQGKHPREKATVPSASQTHPEMLAPTPWPVPKPIKLAQ